MVKKFHAFCKPWIFSSCAIYSQSKYEALRTTSFSLWNISKLASILHVAYLGCASDLIKGIEKWDELLPRYGLCITFSCFVRFLHILNWKGYYKWMKLHNYFHIYIMRILQCRIMKILYFYKSWKQFMTCYEAFAVFIKLVCSCSKKVTLTHHINDTFI